MATKLSKKNIQTIIFLTVGDDYLCVGVVAYGNKGYYYHYHNALGINTHPEAMKVFNMAERPNSSFRRAKSQIDDHIFIYKRKTK